MDKHINGTFVWTIDKVVERRTNREEAESGYFFTKLRPYKVSLGMFPDGIDDVAKTGLTIWLYVYSDIRDGVLPWPLSADVSITITNRATPHIGKMIKKHCVIQEPEYDSFECSDTFDFLYSDLSSDSLLIGDCMVVECRVDLR